MIDPLPASLLPPLVAIVMAVATRRIFLSLAAGIFVGVGVLVLGQPSAPAVAIGLTADLLIQSVWGRDHLLVLAFSLLLGAMVGVLERGGAMASLINRVATRLGIGRRSGSQPGDDLRDRNRAQQLIAATGLVIFFDDYANTLLVGGTMRSTADRFGISREKLAYLVDSTSAPIAGLSIVSTWAAIEMSYMGDGLRAAGIDSVGASFELFWRSIAYRFYPIFALTLVAILVVTGRDFGPMRAAERRSWDSHGNIEPDDTRVMMGSSLHWAAVIPILGCLTLVLAMLSLTGWASSERMLVDRWWIAGIKVLGEGDPYLSLVVGGAFGLSSTLWLHRWLGPVAWRTLGRGVFDGGRQMLPAMGILWLAWALTSVCESLGTGQYLATTISGGLAPTLLPSVIFLVAGGMAFATGTSWGTMGLLTPLVVQLACEMELSRTLDVESALVQSPLVLSATGAVLAGAIFGDHCSPISDTTVLSSRSSGCDHLSHVSTQWPYAMLAALIALGCQVMMSTVGGSPLIWLIVGSAIMWAVVRVIGSNNLLPEPCHSRFAS